MIRLALTLLLLLLVGCAETPPKPTTSGGSSSGSGKIVTATPEDPYECDSDLILEPHLPEECIPPEPPEPVAQKPVEPPKVDPIVGVYKDFWSRNGDDFVGVLRVYADGFAGRDGSAKQYSWERVGQLYRLYYNGLHGKVGELYGVFKYQSVKGEPDLVLVSDKESRYTKIGWMSEALKVSSDPNHKFDFYKVQCRRRWSGEDKCWDGHEDRSPRAGWSCRNVGHRLNDERVYWNGRNKHASGPNYADTLEECEEICEEVVSYYLGNVGEGNCSDYDSQRFASDRKP